MTTIWKKDIDFRTSEICCDFIMCATCQKIVSIVSIPIEENQNLDEAIQSLDCPFCRNPIVLGEQSKEFIKHHFYVKKGEGA